MDEARKAYIFFCSDSTEDECLRRNLFGGTAQYESKVKKLQIGDVLFLYNYKSKRLHAKFIAISEVGHNIVPEAWDGDFPLQVRVERVEKYKPITKVDFEHYVSFFNGKPQARLSSEQVEKLKKVFESPYRLPADEVDYRKENAASHPTDDGHWVRSWGEVKIDNWLFSRKIAHGYELPVDDGYCDFLIPTKKGNVYIEYWGMEDTGYNLRRERKIKVYKKLGAQLIQLFPKDLEKLDEVLLQFIK